MADSPILASHYMLNDIILTIEKGSPEDVRQVCDKYVSRYKSDDELFIACNRLLFEKEITPDILSDLKASISALAEKRKSASLKKNPRW